MTVSYSPCLVPLMHPEDWLAADPSYPPGAAVLPPHILTRPLGLLWVWTEKLMEEAEGEHGTIVEKVTFMDSDYLLGPRHVLGVRRKG